MATTQSPGEPERIYIDELAKMLEPQRAVHTIRQWIAGDLLPNDLLPGKEGGRDRLFWVPDQIAGLQDFARARHARRGWAAQHRPNGESS